MANYSTLKTAVANVVKTNGSQEITGANLQTVLLSIINSIGGGGYIFNGVATPSTDAGTPDQNVFYIGGAGTYANFGTSVIVPPTNIAVFKYNGSWTCEQVMVENGGVFDISAFKAVGGTLATYADLSAALGTGGANVPEGVRKGGMSIKFVQSSDNKYVQYRLTLSTFNTTQFGNVANWQGVDDEPTAGSENLIKSGGVEEQISKIYGFKEKEYHVSINAEIVTFEFPVKIPNGQTVTLTAKTENAVINMFRVYVNEIDTLHPIMEDANSTVQYTATEDVTKLILYVKNTTAAGSLTFTTDYNIDFSLENAFREIKAIPNKVVESEYDTFGVFKIDNNISANAGSINITIPIPKIEAGQSVRLISKGSAVITTYRIYGNVSGEQNSKIENVNDEVIYTPSVDVTSLILLIGNCTTEGNVEITLLNKNSVEGEAKYANNRIDSLPDCYGKAINLELESGCFLYADGSAHSNVSYKRTSYLLPVKEGDTFVFLADAGANVAVVAAYDGHNSYLKKYSVKGNDGYTVVRYVVPQGVKKVRFTLSSSDNYTPFVTQVFKSRTEQLDSINTGIYQKEKVELTDGEPLMLDGKNDHKTNWIIEANFRGLTGFTNILVGKGPNENLSHGGMWLNITPYAVIPTYSTGAYQGVDHGLTITDYLDVRIESFVDKTDESESYTGSGDATYIRYTLFDGNKQFTLDKVFFMGSEEPFVQVNGISSAKVDLYYWCTDLKNNLWCYGDSYFSIAQTRWPYWILTRGYSALFNAMPGANSEFMWKRFCHDLMCGNPRKVFWCLGMNDTDNGAINSNWLKYLTRVIDICRLRGIEVILATIPNTPTMDNSYKNAYIKTLGFKYVDFASAILNVEGTGWIDGMMEDNVHPNKKGAKCLANAAMKLFISYKTKD